MAISLPIHPLCALTFDLHAILTPTCLPLDSRERNDDIRTAGKNMPLSHLISVPVRSHEHACL
jgi:hypothetical protein